jgi:hypothetical protein
VARQAFSKTLEELGFTQARNKTKMLPLAGQFTYVQVPQCKLHSTLAFDETGQGWRHTAKIGLSLSGFTENKVLAAEVANIARHALSQDRVH